MGPSLVRRTYMRERLNSLDTLSSSCLPSTAGWIGLWVRHQGTWLGEKVSLTTSCHPVMCVSLYLMEQILPEVMVMVQPKSTCWNSVDFALSKRHPNRVIFLSRQNRWHNTRIMPEQHHYLFKLKRIFCLFSESNNTVAHLRLKWNVLNNCNDFRLYVPYIHPIPNTHS